jgi:hypothetical protein
MAVKLAKQLRLITATAAVSVLLAGVPAWADHALECDRVQLPSALLSALTRICWRSPTSEERFIVNCPLVLIRISEKR